MNLQELRDNIDELDTEIVSLLNRRCELASKVGEWKSLHDIPFYVPEREKELFERLTEKNSGPITDKSLYYIYREIISAAIALEKPLKIAVLANVNNNGSLEAARKTFGDSAQYHKMESTSSLFDALKRGYADYAVIPVIDKQLNFLNEIWSFVPQDAKVCAERSEDDTFTSGLYCICGEQSPEPTSDDRTLVIIQGITLMKVRELSEVSNMKISFLYEFRYENKDSLLCEFEAHITGKQMESFFEVLKSGGKIYKLGSYPLLTS